jgi:hypothetical protein
MAVVIQNFSGVAPAKTPWKLPLGMAQVAQNVNPDSRTIKPWKDAVTVSSGYTAGATTTIFRFGRSLISDVSYWFQWTKDVDVVKGPIIGDTSERTFYTGDGAPKWTNSTLALTGGAPYPAAYRDLGVTRPTGTPVMSVSGTATSNDYRQVGYAYTNVTAYGEESAPSPICTSQSVFAGQTASITGFDTLPSGNGSCVTRRLYRTVTSSTDTNLYFVKESSSATIVDDVGSNIGEVIQTTAWVPPPSTMAGLIAMANGILIGFTGNDVCVSAQYAPYAWPVKYKLSTDFPIVGLCAMGNQAVVLTWGNPYMLSGTTSDALSLTKIESPEACVSKRSIRNITSPMPTMSGANIMVGTVYYASQNGLCACDTGGSIKVVTNGLLNREDWQALNPTSIQGYVYNGRYFGFFNTGTVQGGFCFDPRGDDTALTLFPFYATGGFFDIAMDHMLLQVGTNIVLWNSSSTPLTATWRSGIIGTKPMVYRFAQVFARAYAGAVIFNLYADGFLIWTEVVADSRPFSLPCEDKAIQWEIEIITTSEVYEFDMAINLDDLRQAGGS